MCACVGGGYLRGHDRIYWPAAPLFPSGGTMCPLLPFGGPPYPALVGLLGIYVWEAKWTNTSATITITRNMYASSTRLLIQFIIGCLLFFGTHYGIMWICVGGSRHAAQHHRCGTTRPLPCLWSTTPAWAGHALCSARGALYRCWLGLSGTL